ncbi:nitroreductase family deazaflavin-dependent oxidoreductase [Salinibacterium sp. M195]|uniref:nitroreductase family deazaflavin-dependent oxidoreductase n=1 Tax=Salinibacterium sp. M195 TaxID=2583374 RepID=UPI001C627CC2|nr:nitroreductase family deazaflavin-dependent oxidoreductase [Salinibacterium sp. M195]QYH34736.1 nitroreductase family deazaflavin-dependent oxidoreductase [Salinibacterium sp. M195]
MSRSRKFSDVVMKLMNFVHRAVLALSGGRLGWTLGNMPSLELHTTGRVSGIRRSTMLTAPVHGNGRWVIVASKGGDDRDPLWYRNLQANPDAEITVRGRTLNVHTHTASPAEKAELWPQIVAANARYAEYQTKTTRDIPVVICEER